MVDNLTPQARRRAMAAVKSRGTTPERVVNAALNQLRYAARKNVASLPGKPDFVLARKRLVIFVHGCYWHGHQCARGARLPKTNTSYWSNKIANNMKRNKKQIAELRRAKWRVLVIWECQIRRERLAEWLEMRISRFL